MKRAKQMRMHTVARRRIFGVGWEYYCTSCGKVLDRKDSTKRCKSVR